MLTAHLEPLASTLRIYAPGRTYAARDPFVASASVAWIDSTTIEIRGMARNRVEGEPDISIAAARTAIRQAASDAGAKTVQFERYKNGVRKVIVVDLATNRIIK